MKKLIQGTDYAIGERVLVDDVTLEVTLDPQMSTLCNGCYFFARVPGLPCPTCTFNFEYVGNSICASDSRKDNKHVIYKMVLLGTENSVDMEKARAYADLSTSDAMCFTDVNKDRETYGMRNRERLVSPSGIYTIIEGIAWWTVYKRGHVILPLHRCKQDALDAANYDNTHN